MEESNMADFLRQMPEEFIKRRQKFLDLAEECGYDQARIRHYDQKSFRQSILTEKTYETWFHFYLFSELPPTLKRKKTEFATCDGCFFDGKKICYSGNLDLPKCAGEGEKIIFVWNDEEAAGKQSGPVTA